MAVVQEGPAIIIIIIKLLKISWLIFLRGRMTKPVNGRPELVTGLMPCSWLADLIVVDDVLGLLMDVPNLCVRGGQELGLFLCFLF